MSAKQNIKNAPIPVLYEDELVAVFDKPPGLVVIPAPNNKSRTLTEIVNDEHARDGFNFHPCHRLDRETSGAVIFAKGKKNQKLMMDLFHKKAVHKSYIAFVHGVLSQKKGQISKAIVGLDKKRYNTFSPAKDAVTEYEVIRQYKNFCSVNVRPITGRNNQIRIHFADIKHPLVGERKYAFGRDYKLKFKRVCLHAHSLEWASPKDKRTIQVQSKLANDMEVFLARHRD